MFINNYCRTSINDESEYWYYCIETNVPLLPTFYNDLAIGFQTETYLQALSEIEKTRGTADGDNIVDKYSGYVIKKLQYDENEGYEANGFKRVTREVMEEEEDIVLSTSVSSSNPNQKHMAFKKDITKKLKTLDAKLKINTKQQHEFIIKYMICCFYIIRNIFVINNHHIYIFIKPVISHSIITFIIYIIIIMFFTSPTIFNLPPINYII